MDGFCLFLSKSCLKTGTWLFPGRLWVRPNACYIMQQLPGKSRHDDRRHPEGACRSVNVMCRFSVAKSLMEEQTRQTRADQLCQQTSLSLLPTVVLRRMTSTCSLAQRPTRKKNRKFCFGDSKNSQWLLYTSRNQAQSTRRIHVAFCHPCHVACLLSFEKNVDSRKTWGSCWFKAA